MQYPVIVRPEATDQYVAQPLGIPELRIVAPTEAEAVARVSQALDQWLASAKIIQVAIPGGKSGNPWLDTFGRSANDPDFDEFLEELQ
jgi:predicted RNase H-like HicB family nuclease